MPGIRVLLYGYDIRLKDNDSKQLIEDLGSFLLECILAFRGSDGVRGPIYSLDEANSLID